MAFSQFWGESIGRKIQSLIKKYNLTWLRVTVSHRKYTNLNQMFQVDLKKKCALQIFDEDKKGPQPCNCNIAPKMKDGKCLYNGRWRQPCVVYKGKDKLTGQSYIGETQRHLNFRTQEHMLDAWKVIESGLKLRPDGDWYEMEDALKLMHSPNTLQTAIQRSQNQQRSKGKTKRNHGSQHNQARKSNRLDEFSQNHPMPSMYGRKKSTVIQDQTKPVTNHQR